MQLNRRHSWRYCKVKFMCAISFFIIIINFKTPGHPTTVSSKIPWKHFLGYPGYFYISRNAFSAVLEILHLFCHPRTTEDFSKLLGLQYYFPENFRCNLTFYESDNFSNSSLHRIFESENFRFPFSTKKNQTLGVKWEKLNFSKSSGIC